MLFCCSPLWKLIYPQFSELLSYSVKSIHRSFLSEVFLALFSPPCFYLNDLSPSSLCPSPTQLGSSPAVSSLCRRPYPVEELPLVSVHKNQLFLTLSLSMYHYYSGWKWSNLISSSQIGPPCFPGISVGYSVGSPCLKYIGHPVPSLCLIPPRMLKIPRSCDYW